MKQLFRLILIFGVLLFGTSSCRMTSDSGSEAEHLFTSPDRITGDFLTIDALSEMNDAQLFKLIADRATNLSCLPFGVSAGKPGRLDKSVIAKTNRAKTTFYNLFKFMDSINSGLGSKVADVLWAGKIFNKAGPDCREGKGANRILGTHLITFENKVFPVAEFLNESTKNRHKDDSEDSFVAALQKNQKKRRNSGVKAASLIELDYSEPENDPLDATKSFGVRDIMVPVVQKDNSVIFIGRAYTGTWLEGKSGFKSDGMVAWFFLDFTERAKESKDKDQVNVFNINEKFNSDHGVEGPSY